MAKQSAIEIDGTVVEALSNAMFKLEGACRDEPVRFDQGKNIVQI